MTNLSSSIQNIPVVIRYSKNGQSASCSTTQSALLAFETERKLNTRINSTDVLEDTGFNREAISELNKYNTKRPLDLDADWDSKSAPTTSVSCPLDSMSCQFDSWDGDSQNWDLPQGPARLFNDSKYPDCGFLAMSEHTSEMSQLDRLISEGCYKAKGGGKTSSPRLVINDGLQKYQRAEYIALRLNTHILIAEDLIAYFKALSLTNGIIENFIKRVQKNDSLGVAYSLLADWAVNMPQLLSMEELEEQYSEDEVDETNVLGMLDDPDEHEYSIPSDHRYIPIGEGSGRNTGDYSLSGYLAELNDETDTPAAATELFDRAMLDLDDRGQFIFKKSFSKKFKHLMIDEVNNVGLANFQTEVTSTYNLKTLGNICTRAFKDLKNEEVGEFLATYRGHKAKIVKREFDDCPMLRVLYNRLGNISDLAKAKSSGSWLIRLSTQAVSLNGYEPTPNRTAILKARWFEIHPEKDGKPVFVADKDYSHKVEFVDVPKNEIFKATINIPGSPVFVSDIPKLEKPEPTVADKLRQQANGIRVRANALTAECTGSLFVIGQRRNMPMVSRRLVLDYQRWSEMMNYAAKLDKLAKLAI